jgi:hypothetical protein
MITQPTTSRLLEVVQRELAENVLPTVTDPQAVASLQMIHHILGTLSIRAEHEIEWLVEETDALRALGVRLVDALADGDRVAAALTELDASPAQSLRLSDVAARYSLASEILSCAVEDVQVGTAERNDVEALLDARLEHEALIMGEFQLVGRS